MTTTDLATGVSAEVLSMEGTVCVLLRGSTPEFAHELAQSIRNTTGRSGVLVLNVPYGEALNTLDEEQMRAAGWVRALPSPQGD